MEPPTVSKTVVYMTSCDCFSGQPLKSNCWSCLNRAETKAGMIKDGKIIEDTTETHGLCECCKQLTLNREITGGRPSLSGGIIGGCCQTCLAAESGC